jgi:mycothiol synthase
VSEEQPYAQLQMVWPTEQLSKLPEICLPAGYMLRTYQPGDEPGWYRLMDLAGWPGWDDETLQPWIARVLPESWFVLLHTGSGQIVASAMGIHDHSDLHPFGGELGWVCADPDHAGRGLGLAVSSAVTRRLISAGYRDIHLKTDDHRLPALKTYFKLGYVPFLFLPEMQERWQAVCEQLNWPFTPEVWRTAEVLDKP